MKPIDRQRLQAFLYMLARDHLTTGKIEKLLEQLPWRGNYAHFSCPLLSQIVLRWMEELEVE